MSRLLFLANHGAGRLALSIGQTGAAARFFDSALNALDVLSGTPHDNEDASARVMVLNDIAIAAESRGDIATSESAYRELVDLYRDAEDPWAEAFALSALGTALQDSGREDEAHEAFDLSAALRLRLGDGWGAAEARELSEGEASSKSVLGTEPSVAMNSVAMNNGIIAASYLQLGHIASERGDKAAALPLLHDALGAYNRAGDSLGAAIVNERIALVTLRQGDLKTARQAIEEALLLRRLGRRGTPVVEGGGPEAADFTRRVLQEIERRAVA